MRYQMNLSGYDMLDQVHVAAHIIDFADRTEKGYAQVFEMTTDVPGVGESDPREWFKDALIAALEAC